MFKNHERTSKLDAALCVRRQLQARSMSKGLISQKEQLQRGWTASTSLYTVTNTGGLRTVLTFVSVHMFCASHKQWFKHTGVDIEAIKYATKYTTKIKAKFSYCDQIKFNEPVLKPGTSE